MYVIEEDPKSREAVLRNIAASTVEQYEGMPARMDIAVQKAKVRGTIEPVRLLRAAVVQYLGAAYFLRDRERFRAAAAALSSHSEVLVSAFSLEPSLLETDLCLALLGGPAKVRRKLIEAVCDGAERLDPSDARGRLVVILALLADLNRDEAAAEIGSLTQLCEEESFERQEATYLQSWLRAARGVAAGAAYGLVSVLQELDRESASRVEHEADRLLRGGSSPITAASFLDLPAAALGALAAAMLPSAERPVQAEGSFADYRWITESAWG